MAPDWNAVEVKDGFDARRVRNVRFSGKIRIGALSGTVTMEGGVALRSGIVDSTIDNCEIGDNVRISNVRGHIANYVVGDGAVIVDVGVMATGPGASFGNGVSVEAVNEAGGREVKIFDELSSQFAYLTAMHRYRPRMIERLDAMVDAYTAKVKSDRGKIGAGASITHCDEIRDVNIGPGAKLSGARRLTNGTILSEPGAPTFVGSNVIADDFIFAEGASVDSGVVLTKVFIGQASKVGRTFSAENCLFFANCEGFHSEAVALFAGPYTVTHHRSTLLIAGLFSFYNAGSGTNQSNHMYKLGPAHQGVLERGAKTGSGSYMMWPCVVSPFSVIIGKNMSNFDIGEFPFSYVTAEDEGSLLTPAMNMFTVGTTRDGEKWPARDRRKATNKRDLIVFDVFSPYTIERMMRGEAVMSRLAAETPKDVNIVRYKGVIVKRLLLRGAVKNYRNAVDMYLQGKIIERAKTGNLAVDPAAVYSSEWADISGLLIARKRLVQIEDAIESGQIATIEDLSSALRNAYDSYAKDEWAFVREVYKERTGKSVDDLTEADLKDMEAAWKKAKASFNKKILADGEKEFDEITRMGFGADASSDEIDADFEAVRGTFDGNSFVKKMKKEIETLSS
ncbi:MAG: hypothetical protein PWP23_2849 [Candidatus Sumerlaeota bacterium]|nr:hypothetical protein [Candidatus Sumerlaeota bacterium]